MKNIVNQINNREVVSMDEVAATTKAPEVIAGFEDLHEFVVSLFSDGYDTEYSDSTICFETDCCVA